MALRGVIFDMGGTLLHYNAPNATWEDTEKTGAQGIYERLQAEGLTLPPRDTALETAWDYTFGMWTQLDQYQSADLKLNRFVDGVLRAWHITNASAALITAASEAYMTAIQQHVLPLEGAARTLRTLRERGLRVGLISNTLWPGAYHRHDLDRYGLTPYLEDLIFSADVDAWKPHAAIFQRSLDTLDLTPADTVYVGDSLYFDVWGAQQAGLRGIWIEQSTRRQPDDLDVTPDATIKRLPDLLAIVDAWRADI